MRVSDGNEGIEASSDRLHGTRTLHQALLARCEGQIQSLDRLSVALSIARLVSMVAALGLVVDGLAAESRNIVALGGLALAAFVGLVIVHTVVANRRDEAVRRRDVHTRHLQRIAGAWAQLPCSTSATLTDDHAYAHDLDLVGHASLFHRLDTTHTVHGERTLLDWLGAPATIPVIRARQAAVSELSQQTELRQELEASTRHEPGGAKINAERFLEFTSRPDLVSPGVERLAWVLPLLTAVGLAGELSHLFPRFMGLAPLALQFALALVLWAPIGRKLDLLDARQREVEGVEKLLYVIETATFECPLLKELRQRLDTRGLPPSKQLARLRFWVGLAEVRRQVMLYPFVNVLLLWDIHVISAIERWNRRTGSHFAAWLAVIGEIEALSSLATLHTTDGGTTFPELVSEGDVSAKGLAHPLLTLDVRQPNDLSIAAPNGLMIVTGSNMAGKSTLLRAVGLNLALSFCGGPVCARAFRTPVLRVRASTRARDSLETGASYFRAELTKLKTVIARLDETPPVFFLLDELLRGTNAGARAIGARAVVTHLTRHGARGMVATHDYTLCDLEGAEGVLATNVHFTDVMISGEMTFDYKLSPGRAVTSNALRLLELAGIPVQRDSSLGTQEGPASRSGALTPEPQLRF